MPAPTVSPHPPPDPDLAARLEAARRSALAAQPLILRHFLTGVAPDTKPDGSPVTAADRDAEELIRTRIEREWPADGLIGEEHGARHGTSEYRWVIDPIDGTKSFIHGVPLFGTLIGIQKRVMGGSDPLAVGATGGWRSAAGVVRFPALDQSAWGALGAGAFHAQGQHPPVRARVSAVPSLEAAVVSVTSPRSMLAPENRSFYLALNQRCRLSRGWSDCFGSFLVATGRIEAMIDPPMQLWDVAALAPIIEEAGGRLTGWDGSPADGSTGAVATNGLLHEAILALMRAG